MQWSSFHQWSPWLPYFLISKLSLNFCRLVCFSLMTLYSWIKVNGTNIDLIDLYWIVEMIKDKEEYHHQLVFVIRIQSLNEIMYFSISFSLKYTVNSKLSYVKESRYPTLGNRDLWALLTELFGSICQQGVPESMRLCRAIFQIY